MTMTADPHDSVRELSSNQRCHAPSTDLKSTHLRPQGQKDKCVVPVLTTRKPASQCLTPDTGVLGVTQHNRMLKALVRNSVGLWKIIPVVD